MFYVLLLAAFLALGAVAVFVWTAVRAGVRQAVDNAARKHRTEAPAAWFTPVGSADPDAPVDYWPTYTDERAMATDPTPGVRPQSMDDLRKKCY